MLGIGGALTLQALGFNIRTYHLNEGHAALLTLHLLRQFRRPTSFSGSRSMITPMCASNAC